MRKALLHRNMEAGRHGTFGTFLSDFGWTCRMVELPWKLNEPNISCIPIGTYLVRFRESPRHGNCYHVENVPSRTDIEIHAANFASDLLGCMAPGRHVSRFPNGKVGVTNSRETLTELENHFGNADFELNIY